MTTNPQPTSDHPGPVLRSVRIPAHDLRVGDVIVDDFGHPTSAVTSVRLEGAPSVVSAGFAFTRQRRTWPTTDHLTVLRGSAHHSSVGAA